MSARRFYDPATGEQGPAPELCEHDRPPSGCTEPQCHPGAIEAGALDDPAPARAECIDCDGSGDCQPCDGTGVDPDPDPGTEGEPECGECMGEGVCPWCAGTGLEPVKLHL